MRLRWSTEAIRDLIALRAFIAKDNPHAAREAATGASLHRGPRLDPVGDVAERILAAVQQVTDHPALGRPGRISGTRELIVTGTPYLIPYRVHAETIELLRVLHAARRWPEKL